MLAAILMYGIVQEDFVSLRDTKPVELLQQIIDKLLQYKIIEILCFKE